MKLKLAFEKAKKYGFQEELDYNKSNFNGHQIGIAICIKNNVTEEIENNFLNEKLGDEEKRDFLLEELLHDKEITLIEKGITQFDKATDNLIPKTIYFIPYVVKDHSRFKPTIINDNVSGACNVSYDILVELIFSVDGLCRYLTVPFKTRNISIMELVNDLFEDEDELSEIGINWEEETEDDEPGYTLDFYDETGERFNLVFHDAEDFKEAIVSMRVIDIVCHID